MNIKILSLWIMVALMSQPLMAMHALQNKQDEVYSNEPHVRVERQEMYRKRIQQANPHLRPVQAPSHIPQEPDLAAIREEMNLIKIQESNPHRDPLYRAESEARSVLAQINAINKDIEDLVLKKDVIKQALKLTKKEKESKLVPVREKEYQLYEKREALYATLKNNIFLKRAEGRQLRADLREAANKEIGKAKDIRARREDNN